MESAEICFECEEHYGLNTEKIECGTIDHCKTMINNTHCSECEEHYGLNTEKTECGTIDHCKTSINTWLINTHCSEWLKM